jgi:hypothetical protein
MLLKTRWTASQCLPSAVYMSLDCTKIGIEKNDGAPLELMLSQLSFHIAVICDMLYSAQLDSSIEHLEDEKGANGIEKSNKLICNFQLQCCLGLSH